MEGTSAQQIPNMDTWIQLQRLADHVGRMTLPPRPDSAAGDREPRDPRPIAPHAGAVALELIVAKKED